MRNCRNLLIISESLSVCVTNFGSSGWKFSSWVQGIAIDPAFPQPQITSLADLELINTFALNDIQSSGNRKMSQTFSNNQNSFNVSNTFNYTVPDDESKILAWLSPLEPLVRHRDIGAQRVDSIGAWVLETSEFRRWHGGSRDGSGHATLFCHGNPGVGKSYIR